MQIILIGTCSAESVRYLWSWGAVLVEMWTVSSTKWTTKFVELAWSENCKAVKFLGKSSIVYPCGKDSISRLYAGCKAYLFIYAAVKKAFITQACRYLVRRHSGGIRPLCNGKGSKMFPSLSNKGRGSGSSSPTLYPPRGELILIYAFLSFSEGKTTFGSDKTFLGLGKRCFPWLCIIGQLNGLSMYQHKEHEPWDVIYTQQYFYTKKCK